MLEITSVRGADRSFRGTPIGAHAIGVEKPQIRPIIRARN